MTTKRIFKNDFDYCVEKDGSKYPVLHVNKRSGKTEPCPFCGLRHEHSKSDGHRHSHCSDFFYKRKLNRAYQLIAIHKDGTVFHAERGYFIMH